MKRKTRKIVLWTATILLPLLAIYVGAYYKMVRPAICILRVDPFRSPMQPMTAADLTPALGADYGYGIRKQDYIDAFFEPIYLGDRVIRPGVWQPSESNCPPEIVDPMIKRLVEKSRFTTYGVPATLEDRELYRLAAHKAQQTEWEWARTVLVENARRQVGNE